MRKSSRLVSVVFSYLAVILALSAVPAMGQATLTVTSWFPPISTSLTGSPLTGSPCDYFTFPAATPATTCPTTSTAGVKEVTGTIPMWLGSDTSNSVVYNFAMVGKDPTVAQSSQADISVKIIPIRFTAAPSLVFDPENNVRNVKQACSPQPALNMVQESPIFTENNLSENGIPLGKGQFAGLFQRANFWQYTQPKASNPSTVNPGYQVLLSQVLISALEGAKHTIAITSSASTSLPYTLPGQVQTDKTWCSPVAMIEVNALDSLLQTAIIPALKGSSGVVPTDLPIFLLNNVVMYDTDPSNCCILGYHNAYLSTTTGGTAGKLQTYVVVNYDSTLAGAFTGAFPDAPDSVGLSAVIADWMDNPTMLNQTPNWAGGPISSPVCANRLEVSVPTAPPVPNPTPPTMKPFFFYPITTPKFTYHVPDLAFKAWFYSDPVASPSLLQYSLFGNLTLAAGGAAGPPPTCP
jgi:hypothetical protein